MVPEMRAGRGRIVRSSPSRPQPGFVWHRWHRRRGGLLQLVKLRHLELQHWWPRSQWGQRQNTARQEGKRHTRVAHTSPCMYATRAAGFRLAHRWPIRSRFCRISSRSRTRVPHTLPCMYATRFVAGRPGAAGVQGERCITQMEESSGAATVGSKAKGAKCRIHPKRCMRHPIIFRFPRKSRSP